MPIQITAAQPLDGLIDKEIGSLIGIYKALHAAPELSHHEEKTASLVAKELTSLGFIVTERVGKYAQQAAAYGVVAVLKNGQGPVVLLRTDMDALPIEEKTGLAYASTVRTKNDAGQEVGVMHACGHDIHMTSLLGTARLLAGTRNHWRGTVVLVGQPSEETLDGAKAMLDDGLYTRFPKPDFAVAFHDDAQAPAGEIRVGPGFTFASATSVDITVRGVGGHGAKPELSKDPVVIAAQLILALQTIVSRENSPQDPLVVTVGSIHGGTQRNIIPDEVKLQLTVRAYKEEVRRKAITAIERIANGVALSAGLPAELAPIVKVIESGYIPAVYNDPDLTQRIAGVLAKTFGLTEVLKANPIMGSEDFSRYSLEGYAVPSCIFWIGAVDPSAMAKSRKDGVALPFLHSPFFAPMPESTIRAGVKAMTAVALDLLKK